MSAYSEGLKTPVDYLKGIGPKKGALLRDELGIQTFEDLLTYFPLRHVDRSTIYQIGQISGNDSYIQVSGTVVRLDEYPIKNRNQTRLVARLKDETGVVELVWFKGHHWVRETVVPGHQYLVFGRPNVFRGQINIPHPEVELYNEAKHGQGGGMGLQPVYSTTEKLRNNGLDTNRLMKIQRTLLNEVSHEIKEFLPPHLQEEHRLMDRKQALYAIHFPGTNQELELAQHRLKFEELLLTQITMLRHKTDRQALAGSIFSKLDGYFYHFYEQVLPFPLTEAQKRVLREIREDLRTGYQMNRLMQGDVGSGKTVVALMAMLMAIDNGYQAAMIAPTEVLANQHFHTLRALTDSLDLNIRLLTGSTKTAQRREILEQSEGGQCHILVGTHALIEDTVQFATLGLVVVDEQHRFGVAQRAKFWQKATPPPHTLVMTATPIPRTLAMTLYGDLESSVIDELPPGRKPVQTRHVYENKRLQVFGFLRRMIANGQQAFMVYPLIEESANMDYNNLMEGYEAVCREFPAPDYQVAIVHGRMKPEDKDYEMERFKRGEAQILVATTVIEVGVDIPNASVMVIESAERFGLSQLHQLRGRVGRGADQAYCILVTGYQLSQEAKVRMETMVRTNDGFELAEADMNLRGPGDVAGTRQSGMVAFKVANLATDQPILQEARQAARSILESDPTLDRPAHEPIKAYLKNEAKGTIQWSLIP